MKIKAIGIGITLLAALNGCSVQSPGAFTDEDRAAIEALSNEWLAAHTAKDWDALITLYTDDAVFIPPEGPLVQGKEDIRTWFLENESDARVELNNIEIEGVGDLAYVRGESTITVLSETGSPTAIRGVYLDIRRRSPDGSWLVSRDMVRLDPSN